MLIAHVSDLHALSLVGANPLHFLSKRFAGAVNLLLKRRQRYPVRLAEAVIADINRVRPDHVVITGDLTNLSLPGEFRLARRLLDEIALGPSSVSVVPGNHDVYVWTSYFARDFEQAMAPYLLSDGADTPKFPVVRVRGDMAFIGVSTALPSPVPFADGWVGARQLAAIEDALTRTAGKFRILALHHPPTTNRHFYLRALRDRGALQKILARTGAELILHGHEHRDQRETVAGPNGARIPVIGVGSATHEDHRPERRSRYNLYRIEGTRLVSAETRIHDPDSDTYRPAA